MAHVETIKVSERSLQRAAQRLLSGGGRLVSIEINYLLRKLEGRTTQDEIDRAVIAVRKLPWSALFQ